MFFIGQNLKQIHMTYSFLELLIFLEVLSRVYFSLHQKNSVYKYKLQGKPIVKEINKYTFSFFSNIYVKKFCFLHVVLNSLSTAFNFSHFYERIF